MLDKFVEWTSDNRGTAIGIVLLCVVVIWGFLFGEGSPLREPATTVPEPSGVELRQLLDEADATPPPVSETPEAETRRIVDTYAKEAYDAPTHPDAPARLLAAGNLQMERLNNPREAAGYYAQIIYNYPTWEGINGVYPQLAKAYELSGQEAERQRILEEMIAKFPPEAPERQYAEVELGRRDPVLPRESP